MKNYRIANVMVSTYSIAVFLSAILVGAFNIMYLVPLILLAIAGVITIYLTTKIPDNSNLVFFIILYYGNHKVGFKLGFNQTMSD